MPPEKESFRFDDTITDNQRTSLQKYQDTIIGNRSVKQLLLHELLMLLVNPLPGALGVFLRKQCFPVLLGGVGKGVIFGRSLGFRSASHIYIGADCMVDDYVMLGHRGQENHIRIGERCLLGRFTQLHTRGGNIDIGHRVNISSSCHLVSASNLTIGDHTLIAGGCYIGGLQHTFDDPNIPIVDQPMQDHGGVKIGRDCWLGAHVIVSDGVTIGQGCVIGANSVVTKSLPPFSVALGSPAKVLRQRG